MFCNFYNFKFVKHLKKNRNFGYKISLTQKYNYMSFSDFKLVQKVADLIYMEL